MRTAHSSSHGGGLVLIPLNFPLGCWPGPDPPQFPPWVWAWIWSPSISPLGMGLDLIPLNFPLGVGMDLIPLNFPLGYGPGSDPPQFPPWLWAWRGASLAGGLPGRGGLPPCTEAEPLPVNRMTDRCKNITLLQTSFAGGNEKEVNGCLFRCAHVI